MQRCYVQFVAKILPELEQKGYKSAAILQVASPLYHSMLHTISHKGL